MPLAVSAPPAGAVESDWAVKLVPEPVDACAVRRRDRAGAGGRDAGEGVGAADVAPAGAGDRAVVVGGDSGVGVGGARGEGGEAAGRAALEEDRRARARVVRVGQPAEAEAGRRGRGGGVDHHRRRDAGRVADVVGAGEGEQVAVAAGDGLAGRTGDRGRGAVAAAAVAGERRRLDGQRGVGEAGSGAGLRLGVVGAAVDRQRRPGREVARAAAARGRGAVGREGATGRGGRVDLGGEAGAATGESGVVAWR